MDKINVDSYNKIASIWSSYRDNKEINKCIVDFSKLLKTNGLVLDIGCGTGKPIANYLANNNFKVTGIDVSEKMLEIAKGYNIKNADFYLCDIRNFNSDIKYDGIIAFDSLWYLYQDEQIEVFKKIANLLNDKGYFLFTSGKVNCSSKGEMFSADFTYYSLSIEEIKELLESNGLKIISMIEDYQEKTTGSRELLVVCSKN